MKISFENIGWTSKVAQKRSTFSVSINKLVALGNMLEKGEALYSYLAKDEDNRPIMITYLDSKPKKKCKRRVA
ncbi:MAG: hypothetical protein ABIH82_01800 [Candidatus Woesearchaeota archaeon]